MSRSESDRAAGQLEPDMLDGFWRQRSPGQIPDVPSPPERLDGASIDLEGRALVPVETARAVVAGHKILGDDDDPVGV